MERNRIKMLYLLLLAFSFGLLLHSCKKEEDPKQQTLSLLQGSWDVQSFTIDGVEYFGWEITYMEIEFEEYSNNEGDFKWTINFDGEVDITTGDYECNASGTEVEMTFKTGDTFTGEIIDFDIDLTSEDLDLEGTVDGYRVIISAER